MIVGPFKINQKITAKNKVLAKWAKMKAIRLSPVRELAVA
jgi:hypothetical protein